MTHQGGVVPRAEAEIHCLVLAVREGAVSDLREGMPDLPAEAAAERLATRLRSDLRYDDEAASWTAGALAGALLAGAEKRMEDQVGYCLSCHETVAVAPDGEICSVCGEALIDVWEARRQDDRSPAEDGPSPRPVTVSDPPPPSEPGAQAGVHPDLQSFAVTGDDPLSAGQHMESPGQKAPTDFINWLEVPEKLGLIEGIGSTRTDRTRVLLTRLAGDSDSRVASAAVGALTKIQASPKRRGRNGQLMAPADAAVSIGQRRRSRQLQSLGRMYANPTKHNREVLHGLSRGKGRLALDARRGLADLDDEARADLATLPKTKRERPQ